MQDSIFREYDIRGRVPAELDEETVVLIGKAFGTTLRRKGKKIVTVGGDVRLHTESLRAAFIGAVNGCGIDVIDIGTVTTPLAYFSAYHLPVDGFAMVTASHNPKDYNGLKLGIGKTTFFGADILALRDLARSGDFMEGRGRCEKRDITEDYIRYLASKVRLSRPLKVVLDPANATGALFAKRVLEAVGAQVLAINDTVDGNFPSHHPDPTVWENMRQLSQAVLDTSAAVGIGLDGDSDRVGLIDEKGRLIPGDMLTLLLARDILKKLPGAKIIYEVKCSMALEEEIKKAGGKPLMWKVGHSLLKQKMAEEGAPLAGEMSGHIFIADDYFGYDDALYAALRLLEILDRSGKKLGELLSDVPQYFNTPEIRVGTENDAEKFRIAAEAAEYFKARYPVIDIDGVRVLFEDGWGLVRASNTQPSLVTRFEGKTEKRRDEIRDLILGKLETLGRVTIGVSH